MDQWRNRIIGYRDEPPEQLLANPYNWRIHTTAQQAAMSSVLDTVGFVQAIIVNQMTGHVIDGHMRVELAISRGEATVPVIYVHLTEDEEKTILATFDPLGGMAVADREILATIMRDIELTDPNLTAVVADLAHEQLPEGIGDEQIERPPDPPRWVIIGDIKFAVDSDEFQRWKEEMEPLLDGEDIDRAKAILIEEISSRLRITPSKPGGLLG